ncbi:MAG: VCBS repeat-containing protein [Syntrophobacterales bacterium]|nr:MAG: VCBS repeat-containing protein [Syntrophobacterales bacterium]
MKLAKIFILRNRGHETRITDTNNAHVTRTRLTAVVLLSLAMATIFALPTFGARPVRVAILPFQIHSSEDLGYLKSGIYDIISSRLVASGQIDVTGKSRIERVLAEMRPARVTEEVAREAGIRLKADYVLLGSITKIGDFISIDARLMDPEGKNPPSAVFAQTKGLDQLMVKVDEFARDIGGKILREPSAVAKEGEVKAETPSLVRRKKSSIVHGQEGVGFQRSQEFPFEIKGLDIGDVDGDGENEIVVMGEKEVRIYEYQENKIRLFKKLSGSRRDHFTTLNAVDLNRNGVAEIVVTNLRNNRLRSFILEYEEGRFRKIIDGQKFFFRVLQFDGKGQGLFGQKMGFGKPFSKYVYRFPFKGGKFVKGEKTRLPKGLSIFGLTTADINSDGTDEIIGLDESEHLKVIRKDGEVFEELWRSSDYYGGSDNSFEYWVNTSARNAVVYVPCRVLTADLDRDGRVDVITCKNTFSLGRIIERVRSHKTGEMVNLSWDGMGLSESWSTRPVVGYIADYQIGDIDGDGLDEMLVGLVKKKDTLLISLEGRKSVLLFYDFP